MKIYEDAEALAQAAAEAFVHECREAILARGRFVVALSGGSTPKRLHHLLATSPYRDYVEWNRVHVLFGDERFVPPTNEDSNERMARETLLSHVEVPAGQIHGMYRDGTPEAAAEAYEQTVCEVLRDGLAIDLTILGIGPDGHTASLFPGRPAVHEKQRLVVAAKANAGVEDRITMTVPLLNRSRTIFFLVAGADKREALGRILHGPENWDQTPAQAVARHAHSVHWLADAAAAGE